MATLWCLVPRVDGESFEPQYESLSTGLAAMGKWLGRDGGDRMFAPVTPLTAAHTAIAITAMAVGVVVALALRARTFTDSLIPAVVAGRHRCAAGYRRNGGAVGVAGRRDMFSGFGWLAVVLLAVAGACAPPGPLGAAHALIGLVVMLLGAIAIGVMTTEPVADRGGRRGSDGMRDPRRGGRLCGCFGRFRYRCWRSAWPVGLLVLVRMAPTIALWVARVRPPHFGSITGRDLFARREGMPVDTVSPVSEDETEDEDNELTDITARGAAIATSARLVNAVQVGVCGGVSLLLPAAVWGVLTPGRSLAWLALRRGRSGGGHLHHPGTRIRRQIPGGGVGVRGLRGGVRRNCQVRAGRADRSLEAGLMWPAVAVVAFAAFGFGRSAFGASDAVQAAHPADRRMG